MFTSVRVGNENFVVIPEKEYKSWVKKGFSPEITGSRALNSIELDAIIVEMKNDKSRGIESKNLAKQLTKWKSEL
jgi:hypothetical protein